MMDYKHFWGLAHKLADAFEGCGDATFVLKKMFADIYDIPSEDLARAAKTYRDLLKHPRRKKWKTLRPAETALIVIDIVPRSSRLKVTLRTIDDWLQQSGSGYATLDARKSQACLNAEKALDDALDSIQRAREAYQACQERHKPKPLPPISSVLGVDDDPPLPEPQPEPDTPGGETDPCKHLKDAWDAAGVVLDAAIDAMLAACP
ncbi:MAG: hypothetical protein AAFX07_06270 [Pseudomonadota bacterium]